jgi:hypothetical protein
LRERGDRDARKRQRSNTSKREPVNTDHCFLLG